MFNLSLSDNSFSEIFLTPSSPQSIEFVEGQERIEEVTKQVYDLPTFTLRPYATISTSKQKNLQKSQSNHKRISDCINNGNFGNM